MKRKIILSIITFFVISACNSSAENTKNGNELDSKKELLEAKKQEQEQERIRINEENLVLEGKLKESERQLKLDKLERIFQNVYSIMVTAKKSYFYDTPDFTSKRKAYLVQYDEAEIIRVRNGFGLIEFYNYQTEKTTSGWMSLEDLEPYEPGC